MRERDFLPSSGRWARFALAVLVLSAFAEQASAQTVRGHVLQEVGNVPIPQAEVVLLDADGETVTRATTDADGSFTVSAQALGEFTLRVEHLSFRTSTTDVIALAQGEVAVVEIRLAVQAIALEPLTVVGRRQMGNLRLREFYNRAEQNRQRGSGRIFFREDLDRAHTVQQLIFTIPTRQGCQLEYYLDGARLFPEETLDHMRLQEDVEGIEVYRGVNEIPPRYQRPGTCGVVLVWTRPAHGRPFTWKRGLVAGAFVTIILLLVR